MGAALHRDIGCRIQHRRGCGSGQSVSALLNQCGMVALRRAILTGAQVSHVFTEPGDRPVFVHDRAAGHVTWSDVRDCASRSSDADDVLLHFTFVRRYLLVEGVEGL